ncbi:MAG TPA: hypothetical protein VMZ73_08105, partial [Acidimicrobiales bacterium]|nr:hypothetical protein [Acidimicrobiales bacterium]
MPANIHELWRLDAQAAGFAVDDWFDHVVGREMRVEAEIGPVVEAALAELERRHSTWDRTDVVEKMAARLPAGLARSASQARIWVEHLADQVVAHAEVVRLAREPVLPAPGY